MMQMLFKDRVKSLLYTTGFFVFLAAVVPYVSAEVAAEEKREPGSVGKEVEMHGLRLQVSLKPGHEITYGEGLWTEIRLTNMSESDVHTLTSGSYAGLLIIVETEGGNAIRLTRWGGKRLDSPKGGVSRRSVTLEAGESIEHTIELTRAFDLTEAGSYKVRVGWIAHRDLKEKGNPIKTEDIEFSIEEARG